MATDGCPALSEDGDGAVSDPLSPPPSSSAVATEDVSLVDSGRARPHEEDPSSEGVSALQSAQEAVFTSLSHHIVGSYPIHHQRTGYIAANLRQHSSFEGTATAAGHPSYSDSGFGSTLSNGSSASYLPPPPPYRMSMAAASRVSAKGQPRIHRSYSDSKYGSSNSRAPVDYQYHSLGRGGHKFSRVRVSI